MKKVEIIHDGYHHGRSMFQKDINDFICDKNVISMSVISHNGVREAVILYEAEEE